MWFCELDGDRGGWTLKRRCMAASHRNLGQLPLKLDESFMKFFSWYHQYNQALLWKWNTNEMRWDWKALPGGAKRKQFCSIKKKRKKGKEKQFRMVVEKKRKVSKTILFRWLSVSQVFYCFLRGKCLFSVCISISGVSQMGSDFHMVIYSDLVNFSMMKSSVLSEIPLLV